MGQFMLRIDALTRTRRGVILAAWLMAVVIAVPFAARQSDHLTTGGYAVSGSQSSQVNTTLKRQFPQVARASLAVLLWPHAGATSATLTTDIGRVGNALNRISGVALTKQSREFALFSVGLVGPIVIPLQVSATEDQARDIAETLRHRLGIGKPTSDKVEVHLLGQGALWAGVEDTSKRQLANAEKIGFPILLIVLLTIFGSLSAAVLPLTLGAVAVIVTGGLIYFLSLAMQLSIFTTNTASLLGIGVAVDYSLIILARVRQEIHAGHDLASAREIALATSGTAVAFSGLTVIASLMGLWVIPVGTLRSMAVGAILVVAVAVIASVTLLPALISLLGARRIGAASFVTRIGRRWPRPRATRRLSWDSWTRAVTGHPVVSIAVAGGFLLVLCIPVLSMKTSTGALPQLSRTDDTRVGFAEAAQVAGPGALGPIYVVAHATGSAQSHLRPAIAKLRGIAEQTPNVRRLGTTEIASNNSFALFTIIPSVDPESPTAKRLVEHLRASLPHTLTGTSVSISFGGTSATQLDEERGVASNMWKVYLIVLSLAFIVLFFLLRSLLLPLKAIIMNLLSVGAAYGVLVAVFQWGWADSIFGYHSLGHVDTLTPSLILAIVFALSMDYEIFLLTRIKECWLLSGDSRSAVAEGLAASAKTISSAAFILVCVFAVFIGTGVPPVKELGLGAAVAIALDATVVRLVLVPATMQLLGDWNWWLPGPLARLFPSRQSARSLSTIPAVSSSNLP
jgi:uncharacterized membrane protein YdfJ with MMPL/SSD domain